MVHPLHVGLILKEFYYIRSYASRTYPREYSVSFKNIGNIQNDDQFRKTTCSISFQETKEEEEIYLDAISAFYCALNQNDW